MDAGVVALLYFGYPCIVCHLFTEPSHLGEEQIVTCVTPEVLHMGITIVVTRPA
jgi:hypothetical protein